MSGGFFAEISLCVHVVIFRTNPEQTSVEIFEEIPEGISGIFSGETYGKSYFEES